MTKPLSQVPVQRVVVEHGDTPIEFFVKSRGTTGLTHHVRLKTAEYPHGFCDCKAFTAINGPKQRRGERSCCYHIDRAREAFVDWAINAFYERDLNKDD